MLERIYVYNKIGTKSHSACNDEHKIDLIGKLVRQRNNVEIRHTLLDSVVDAEMVCSHLKTKCDLREEAVKQWDLSNVRLNDLFADKVLIKAFKNTKWWKSRKYKYEDKKSVIGDVVAYLFGLASLIIGVMDVVPVIWLFSTAIPLNIIIVCVCALICSAWIIKSYCDRKNVKKEFFLDEIDRWFHEQEYERNESDFTGGIDFLTKNISKCKLLDYNVNIIINSHSIKHHLLLEVLQAYCQHWESKKKAYDNFYNTNIVYTLLDVTSPFSEFKDDTVSCLELKPLTYEQKMEYLKDKLQNTHGAYNVQRIVLRHLGIDTIKFIREGIEEVKKLREDEPLVKRLRNRIDMLCEETNIKREIFVTLLYVVSFLTSIKGYAISHNQLRKLICGEDSELSSALKIKLKIPTDKDHVNKIILCIDKYISGFYKNVQENDYKFNRCLSGIIYVCEDETIDEYLFDITKFCILKTRELQLTFERTCLFATKVCEFIYKNNRFEVEVYETILTGLEQHGCINYHYVIFDIINKHLARESNIAKEISSSKNIMRSAFLSMVHSPRYGESENDDKIIKQHIEFVGYCAKQKSLENKPLDGKEPPVYMDTFILNADDCKKYYFDLMLFANGDENNSDTIKFIRCLYKLYCISLRDTELIRDEFFFINKTLIDENKTELISEIKTLCKNNVSDELLKNSAFVKFINCVEKLFDGENVINDIGNDCRILYSFLIKMYYYAHNSIIDENFVIFIDLVVNNDNIGLTTRCELLSVFCTYHSFQKRRIGEFLSKNTDEIIKIMHNRINETNFTIELAYKSIPNILSVVENLDGCVDKNYIKNLYVEKICERFKEHSTLFRKDTRLLLYYEVDEEKMVEEMIGRLSNNYPDLVAAIIATCLRANTDQYVYLVKLHFYALKQAILTFATDNIIIYLSHKTTKAVEKERYIFDHVVSMIDIDLSKDMIVEFLCEVLPKWLFVIPTAEIIEIYRLCFECIYELEEKKIKTNANEYGKSEDYDRLLAELDEKYDYNMAAIVDWVEHKKHSMSKAHNKYIDIEKNIKWYNLDKQKGYVNYKNQVNYVQKTVSVIKKQNKNHYHPIEK